MRTIVLDRDRQLAFDGELLARASSHAEDKARWTEVEIYRTVTGAYVVACVGRSRVRKDEEFWDDRLEQMVRSDRDEEDRYAAHVCSTALAVVEVLRRQDGAGAWYLTDTARRALLDAGARDEHVRRAFAVEEVA